MARNPLQTQPRAVHPADVWSAASTTLLIWSGTAIANRVAVVSMSGMTAGVLRSMLAGLVAIAIVLVGRWSLPAGWRAKATLALAGTASFAAWPALLSLGLTYTTAGHAALIMAMLPVCTGLIAAVFERRVPRPGWWLGVAVALVGTVVLVTARAGIDGGSPLGDGIVLGGVTVCALGYVLGGRLTPVIGARATTFLGLACASLVLIPVFLLLAPSTDWSAVSAGAWAGIAYMTLLSSLLGYALWYWALGHGGIARIAVLQFCQPVLTLGLAALILGEAITPPLAFAGATILAGTWLAQRRA